MFGIFCTALSSECHIPYFQKNNVFLSLFQLFYKTIPSPTTQKPQENKHINETLCVKIFNIYTVRSIVWSGPEMQVNSDAILMDQKLMVYQFVFVQFFLNNFHCPLTQPLVDQSGDKAELCKDSFTFHWKLGNREFVLEINRKIFEWPIAEPLRSDTSRFILVPSLTS